MILLNETKKDGNNTELYFKIVCNSRQEFDSALFFHSENLGDMILDQNIFNKDPIEIQNIKIEEVVNIENDTPKLNINFSIIVFCILLLNYI